MRPLQREIGASASPPVSRPTDPSAVFVFVAEIVSISASDSAALPGCDLLSFTIAGPTEHSFQVSLDPTAAGLLLCHLRSLRALSDGLPYGGDGFTIRGESAAVQGPLSKWAPPEPRSPGADW